ncbi:hypothetical protein PILCRDRAFT_76685 [Piloderma croceum F 1598]|uniref:XPG-I domain-containing protein n=1 Tax=Piloderma croceum (strain F 1598) TaxID=765440 RepID=A0A0C3BJC4_PILCF|nr:hypothetical protein PILCRDRAFT_76685 [Piloderma croceum F 1598]
MGVKELWPLLELAGVPISLHQRAIQKGFVDNIRGDRTLWIGIDASHWICAAEGHRGKTTNPELTALLLRRCWSNCILFLMATGDHL